MKNNTSAFDLCLQYGDFRQGEVAKLLAGKKIEFKADKIAYKSGNLCIEYKCRGKPSGLAVTKADLWLFVIDKTGTFIGIKTKRLKELARKAYAEDKVCFAGDDKQSECVLLPIKDIFKN